MRARRRVRQLTILLAVAALLVTAPGPPAGAGAQAPRRPGARPGFQVVSVRGDLHVIPGDVHHLVGRLLDLDLFNVSALQRMGYAHARAPSLPLIVQRRTARRPPALAAASLRPVRELASAPATRSSRWRCRRPGPATGSSAT